MKQISAELEEYLIMNNVAKICSDSCYKIEDYETNFCDSKGRQNGITRS